MGSVYFTPVQLNNIHNLKVKSYVLFSGNFEDLRPERQLAQVKNLAFCGCEYKESGLIEIFP